MKILVVHLLRLGDLIMTTPVIEGLKEKYPNAQIDLLTFKSSRGLQPMLTTINKWWSIDRDELQKGLGESQIPLMTPLHVLDELINEINRESYSVVINLSQTRFAANIVGLIDCHERLGMAIDRNGKTQIFSSWFRHLNDESTDSDIFHQTDIFAQACEIKGVERLWKLNETSRGRQEIADLADIDLSQTVVIQTQTSDVKKNWRDLEWVKIIQRLDAAGYHTLLLGAPNERQRLETLKASCEDSQSKVDVAILSLEGALSLLRRVPLLITLDTSIKHLANASKAKVLEICLGSSDPRHTGVYKEDALILQAQVPCAPCSHSSACHQPTFLCALELSAKVVAESALALLQDNWQACREVAKQNPIIRMLRTRHLDSGFWFVQELAQQNESTAVEMLLNKVAWKFALNGKAKFDFIGVGSEGVTIRREIKELFVDEAGIRKNLDRLEEQEMKRSQEAERQLIDIRRHANQELGSIGPLRQKQMAAEKIRTHADIKTKIIRNLKLNWMESI